MAIDFGKGLKRIYIVLASLYIIFMLFIGLATQNSIKDYKELYIAKVSCDKLREVINNRDEIEKDEEATLDKLELVRFDLFIKKNKLESENFKIIDKYDGCYASLDIKLSFYEKYFGFIFFGGVLGLVPTIIIYFLLSFIINGFRKEK